MRIFGRPGGEALLSGVDLGLERGDTVLAACQDVESGEVLVASSHHLSVVAPDRSVVQHRPWHLVNTGGYDNEADVLTVTWVDRAPELGLHVGGHRGFLQAFRERVQASVVLAETLDLGPGRSARLVIRKDLAADRLIDQVVLAPGVRLADPGVRQRIEATRRGLREQVGLS